MEHFEFFPYTWHIDPKEEEVTSIRIYGINQNKENICVRIDNFTPYIYIELPHQINWTSSNVQLVGNKIDQILGEQRPLKKVLVYKYKLYGAHLNSKGERKKYPYLFCKFSVKNDIKILSYKIKSSINVVGVGRIKLKIHEQDADPILQFICCKELPTAGWILASGKRVENDDKISLCHHEFKCKWTNFEAIERNFLAQPKIMGFDIEVNSTNPSRMPQALVDGDKVFQISCVICTEGTQNYTKYLLSLGNPLQEVVGDDVIIRCFETEDLLLLGFTSLIREENPNVIVGYNILGFDIPYMIERSKRDCYYTFVKQGFHKFAKAEEKTIKWSSSAYKNQEFQYLDAEGRLFVDLLPLVKRDYKMNNYKLQTISNYFLGASKDPLSAKGIFKCYRIGMKGGRNGDKAMGICGKYCVKDSVLVVQLMEKLQTWVGLCEMAKTCNVPIFTLYTQGQQIKVFSQVYKYSMYNNIVVEKDAYITQESDRYVGAHVFPPVPGLYDMVIPFDFCSLYPTTIIAYNIDYFTWVTDPNIPDELCHVMEWEDHIYCAHDPKIIRKLQLTEYINSEKERISQIRNVKNKTKDKVKKKELEEEIKVAVEDLKKYTKERSEIIKGKPKNVMCEKRYFRFLKEPKGVFPTILQNLLDARKNTRNQIKQIKNQSDSDSEENKLLINVLNKRQLAYKISANSMYGAMGVRRGYLPFMPGAMCTTYMGRINIEIVAKTIVEKFKGKLVYGDTDSNYINFPNITNAQEAWDNALYVADQVTKLFPPPIKLDFESIIYSKFFILTKKRYMYRSCLADGVVDNKIGKKGVLLARRDNSAFIRDVYEAVISKIFDNIDRDDVLYFVLEQINKLCSNSFDYRKFIVTKSVGSTGDMSITPFVDEKGKKKAKIGNYTVPILPENHDERDKQFTLKNASSEREYYLKCLPAQVQLVEKMKRRGQRVDAGSRIEYVILNEGNNKAKQYEKIESADYFFSHSNVLKLDFMYYLSLLKNPLDQVLNVAYDKDDDNRYRFKPDFVLQQYNFRMNCRAKMIEEINNLTKPKLVFED